MLSENRFVNSIGLRRVDTSITTGDNEIDSAIRLAQQTLSLNVSEKWGRICPVVAPAWGEIYPTWVHPNDEFFISQVSDYTYDWERAAWPVQLLAAYQHPEGQIGAGLHDSLVSPAECKANYARKSQQELRQQLNDMSWGNKYIRDHFFVLSVYHLWRASGNEDFLRQLFPNCQMALSYLKNYRDKDEDGLIESAATFEDVSLVELGGDKNPFQYEKAMDQVFLFGALKAAAKMAEVLGYFELTAEYSRWCQRIVERFDELFWDPRGFYVYAVDTQTHERVLPDITSVYTNGYAYLYGLCDKDKARQFLEYFSSFDFDIPGPVVIPPFEDIVPDNYEPNYYHTYLKPGVYINGGCGWGRGIMPSVCRTALELGLVDLGVRWVKQMAQAANRTGAFYEYWTWKRYAGETRPGGCPNYSETAAAFLDAVVRGLFGINPLSPGYERVSIAPAFPLDGNTRSINLSCFGKGSIGYELAQLDKKVHLHIWSTTPVDVLLSVPDKYVVGNYVQLINGERIEVTRDKNLSRCIVELRVDGNEEVSIPAGSLEERRN